MSVSLEDEVMRQRLERLTDSGDYFFVVYAEDVRIPFNELLQKALHQGYIYAAQEEENIVLCFSHKPKKHSDIGWGYQSKDLPKAKMAIVIKGNIKQKRAVKIEELLKGIKEDAE